MGYDEGYGPQGRAPAWCVHELGGHLFKRQPDWLQRAFPPFLQVIFQLLVMNKTGLIIFNNILRKCVARACSSQQLTHKSSSVGAESHARRRLLGFGTCQDGGISHNKAVF